MTSIPRNYSIYAPSEGYYLVKKNSVLAYKATKERATTIIQDLHEEVVEAYQDIKTECTPSQTGGECAQNALSYLSSFIHIPFLPAFHSPGWLLRYIVGPYNRDWFDGVTSDIMAGLTVGLLMIPQGLSYAGLANMPQVNGLYAAILPSAFYSFFGSSLQLAVGPVALASLLTGELVDQYGATPGTQNAVNVGTQAALSVGLLLILLSALNLGNMIHYVSRPVMSGFTTGAALIIGLSQLKNAFGFNSKAVPQGGQAGYDYNYQVMQWYNEHWNDKVSGTATVQNVKVPYTNEPIKNYLAVQIAFSIYFPLLIIKLFQKRIAGKLSKESKDKAWWKFVLFVTNITPFIAIIIAASIAHTYKTGSDSNMYANATLSVVGNVIPGLNFLASPVLPYPFGQFLVSCIPVTFVAFMESYAVANRIATQRNELHILNASQELFSIGGANLMSAVSQAFPVCGSFSRSALNAASGARTPLSKMTCLLVVIIALNNLTSTFYFIPQSALAAVIWLAIWNLIDIADFWEAWKHNKSDAFVIFLTFILEFLMNTEIALATGLSATLLMYVLNSAYSPNTQLKTVATAADNDGVDIVQFQASDFTFLTQHRVKAQLVQLSYLEIKYTETPSLSTTIFKNVSTTLDAALRPMLLTPVASLGRGLIVDFGSVRVVDWTALVALDEALFETKSRGVTAIIINIHETVLPQLHKFGIKNYVFDPYYFSEYLKQSSLATRILEADDVESQIEIVEKEPTLEQEEELKPVVGIDGDELKE